MTNSSYSKIPWIAQRQDLADRLAKVTAFGSSVRASEYHVTNACNLRCADCWFFAHGFDTATKEVLDVEAWRRFLEQERARGINCAYLVGGEPTLCLDRVAAFAQAFPYVNVSSNGIRHLPREGFDNVAIGLTLFGGEDLDHRLRAGARQLPLANSVFSMALANYRNDDRAIFIFCPIDVNLIEPTVQRIADNGNRVSFNRYGSYSKACASDDVNAIVDECLRLGSKYKNVIVSPQPYIEALYAGHTKWGTFGYETCPSVSSDCPANAARIANRNPTLPLFNAWAPDLKTINKCCTSGHCEDCHDSQAVYSWLLVNYRHYLDSAESLESWLSIAEAYWSQWVWSPFSSRNARRLPTLWNV